MTQSDPLPQNTWRIRFGFGLLLALLLLLAACKTILFDTLDPDCFWHLRVAEQLHHDGIHPLVDQLSFESIKQPWTPYSWLGELAMKSIWDFGGYRLAIAVQAIVIVGIFFFLALAALEMCRPPKPYIGVALAMVFAGYLALPYLSFRPVTFAMFFISLCVWLMLRDRRMDEASHTIWFVPVLTALLINLHLFALFIPLWCAAMLVGAIWEKRHISHWCERAEHRRRIIRYSILLGTCAIACLMTPMLGGTLRTLLHYGHGDPMVASGAIAELQPFYTGSMWPATAVILLYAACVIIMHREDFRAAEWLMLLIGTICLFRMGRLAPLFVLTASPMLASAMPMLRGKLLEKWPVWITLAVVLALGLLRIQTSFPTSDTKLASWLNRHGPDAPGYPCDAAQYIADNVRPSSGKIINDFNWGGYLAWKLGPKFQVFMDQRTQLYTPDFWKATCLGDRRTMTEALRTVQADAAIVPLSNSKLAGALYSLKWTEVYRDDRAAVMVPASASSADVR